MSSRPAANGELLRTPGHRFGLRLHVLRSLPLRARLVAGFAVAIAVVLTAAGAFVYWRVSYALDRRLNEELRAQAGALAPLVAPSGALLADPDLERTPGARAYQVLDASGRVLSAGSELRTTPLLSPQYAQAAQRAEVIANVGALLPASRHPLRLLAVPLSPEGPARVLVVGERRDERDEALRELLGQLLLAGLGAMVVSAVVGERLAKAALDPVERYRSQVDRIADGERRVRLGVPEGRDDEVTRLGHTLNDMLDALENERERERRFTQDASHELRTPLTLLSTRVQLALRRERTPAEHEAILRDLDRDIAALAALADQLLAISTSDAPDGDSAEVSDLAAVTTVFLDAHGEGAPATGTSLSGASESLWVPVPAAALRQVLANLVGNAHSHGAPPVTVSVAARDGAAVLAVTDAGAGVPGDFLAVAANRFARADVARSRPGAGLGLALVRSLVERHAGDLRLCSAGMHHRYSDRFALPCAHADSGTTVTVLLPIA